MGLVIENDTSIWSKELFWK